MVRADAVVRAGGDGDVGDCKVLELQPISIQAPEKHGDARTTTRKRRGAP